MKIKPHFLNLCKGISKSKAIAITPCLYFRLDSIQGAKSISVMIAWLWYSTGFQIMWLTK